MSVSPKRDKLCKSKFIDSNFISRISSKSIFMRNPGEFMPNTFKLLFLTFTSIIVFSSCSKEYTQQDRAKDIAVLLKENETARNAHMLGDAKMLTAGIADTMISVNRGQITKSSNKEVYERFKNYFKNIEYIKWEDLEDPVINISDDGTMAEILYKKIILVRSKNEKGEWEKGAVLFAWSANHKKINGVWKIISNTSTREDLEFATYDEFYYKGTDALKNNKLDEYLFNMERAYYIAPDNVYILYEYARANAANKNYDKAFSVLNRLADIKYIGLNAFEADTVFQNMKNDKDYKNLLNKISENKKPINNSETAFTITERDLVPEGIAFDNNTGTIYLSSAYKRKILSIDKDGNVKDFKHEAEDDLWSTWGMEVDETRNHLWVNAASASQGMAVNTTIKKSDNGKSKIYKYDLSDGKLLKVYNYDAGGEEHFFNDLTISKSGDVYITESLTSKIYKISKEKDEIELLYQADPMFYFLNGLALNDDETKLFVASSEGVSVLDLKTFNWQLIQTPKNVSLEGIDGMSFYKNTLICQQSSYPFRNVMQYTLDSTNYKVTDYKILESNNPIFDSATTGEIGGDYYYYIANSQVRSAFIWGKNGPEKIKPFDELKDIVILKVKL